MTTETEQKRGRGPVPADPEVLKERATEKILALLASSPAARTLGEISILISWHGGAYAKAGERKQLVAELVAAGKAVQVQVPTMHARKSGAQFVAVGYTLPPKG
jgi:hypothetical protein